MLQEKALQDEQRTLATAGGRERESPSASPGGGGAEKHKSLLGFEPSSGRPTRISRPTAQNTSSNGRFSWRSCTRNRRRSERMSGKRMTRSWNGITSRPNDEIAQDHLTVQQQKERERKWRAFALHLKMDERDMNAWPSQGSRCSGASTSPITGRRSAMCGASKRGASSGNDTNLILFGRCQEVPDLVKKFVH